MSAKVRMKRVMIFEYEPNPEYYPEGFTIEQMAKMDAETDDVELLFDRDLEVDEVTFEIIQ